MIKINLTLLLIFFYFDDKITYIYINIYSLFVCVCAYMLIIAFKIYYNLCY